MANLTIHNIVDAGTAPAFIKAVSPSSVPVGSGHNTFLVLRNGSETTVTITIDVAGDTSYGVPNPGVSISVAAAGEAWFPLRKEHQNPDTPGVATVNIGTITDDVTTSLVRLS